MYTTLSLPSLLLLSSTLISAQPTTSTNATDLYQLRASSGATDPENRCIDGPTISYKGDTIGDINSGCIRTTGDTHCIRLMTEYQDVVSSCSVTLYEGAECEETSFKQELGAVLPGNAGGLVNAGMVIGASARVRCERV